MKINPLVKSGKREPKVGEWLWCDRLGLCRVEKKRSIELDLDLVVRDLSGILWLYNSLAVSFKAPTLAEIEERRVTRFQKLLTGRLRQLGANN